MTAKAPARGHASKHVHKAAKHHKAAGKHHLKAQPKPATGTGHSVHAVAHHAHHAKARGFAVADLLPVCAFEALAMSLRLAGQFVDDDEVAALWEAAGALPLGASLPGALDAANLHGLAGLRPQWASLWGEGAHAADHLALPFAQDEPAALGPFDDLLAGDFHALILGVDRPGPHAVLATPGGWWSWGERYDPWPCRVEEAWLVSWGEVMPHVSLQAVLRESG